MTRVEEFEKERKRGTRPRHQGWDSIVSEKDRRDRFQARSDRSRGRCPARGSASSDWSREPNLNNQRSNDFHFKKIHKLLVKEA